MPVVSLLVVCQNKNENKFVFGAENINMDRSMITAQEIQSVLIKVQLTMVKIYKYKLVFAYNDHFFNLAEGYLILNSFYL